MIACLGSESPQATNIPVKWCDTKTEMPNRKGEDEDDDPPEEKQSKSKRRLVFIVCIVYDSFSLQKSQ